MTELSRILREIKAQNHERCLKVGACFKNSAQPCHSAAHLGVPSDLVGPCPQVTCSKHWSQAAALSKGVGGCMPVPAQTPPGALYRLVTMPEVYAGQADVGVPFRQGLVGLSVKGYIAAVLAGYAPCLEMLSWSVEMTFAVAVLETPSKVEQGGPSCSCTTCWVSAEETMSEAGTVPEPLSSEAQITLDLATVTWGWFLLPWCLSCAAYSSLAFSGHHCPIRRDQWLTAFLRSALLCASSAESFFSGFMWMAVG